MAGFVHENKINTDDFYRGLDAMFAKKDMGQTLQYMEDWLAQAERMNDLPAIVAICNELGGVCRARGDIARALELHNRALLLLEQMGMAETEHYGTALINLGNVYIVAKDFNQAIPVLIVIMINSLFPFMG